jgi:hypothetical protein
MNNNESNQENKDIMKLLQEQKITKATSLLMKAILETKDTDKQITFKYNLSTYQSTIKR